jgi:hypothetical protein
VLALFFGRGFAACEPTVIVAYEHPAYVGAPVIAATGFIGALDQLGRLALDAGVRLHVTSSFRALDADVRGAIVPPASRSNHLVGHAIDMNVVDADGGLCDSGCLRRYPDVPTRVRRFLDAVRGHPLLRWGGDFSTPDVVHVDDGLKVRAPETWERLLAPAQRAFADGCHDVRRPDAGG